MSHLPSAESSFNQTTFRLRGKAVFPYPIHVASGLGPDWPQSGHGIAPEQQQQTGTSYRPGFSNTHLSAGRACVSLLLVHSVHLFLLLLLPTALLGTAMTLSKPPGQLRCCVKFLLSSPVPDIVSRGNLRDKGLLLAPDFRVYSSSW